MFCINCIKDYLRNRIYESYVVDIKCPGMGCQHEMMPDIIQSLVTPEAFEKYEKFKLRANLISDPEICFCIFPDCEGYMKGNKENPRCKCTVCDNEMCFSCKQP